MDTIINELLTEWGLSIAGATLILLALITWGVWRR